MSENVVLTANGLDAIEAKIITVFHVSLDEGRNRQFEMPFWHFKLKRRGSFFTICFY